MVLYLKKLYCGNRKKQFVDITILKLQESLQVPLYIVRREYYGIDGKKCKYINKIYQILMIYLI
jgi:hypothetical protein